MHSAKPSSRMPRVGVKVGVGVGVGVRVRVRVRVRLRLRLRVRDLLARLVLVLSGLAEVALGRPLRARGGGTLSWRHRSRFALRLSIAAGHRVMARFGALASLSGFKALLLTC